MSTLWSAADHDYLRAHYAEESHEEMGAAIGRTRNSVRTRCFRLGLRKKEQEWTEAEDAALRAWYLARENVPLEIEKLARHLNRPVASACQRAFNMGLTKPRGTRQRTARGEDGLTDGQRKRLPKFATKEERSVAQSQRAKESIVKYGHPRGALGMKHSEETKKAQSERSKRQAAAMTPEQREARRIKSNQTKVARYGTAGPAFLVAENPYSRAKGGRREDLGNRYFRSRWEANYARYLNMLQEKGEIASWEYEPQTFVFHGVTRGALSYTPDFKVIEHDGTYCWHEIKGWMDSKSKTKLRRFAKYYPEEKVVVIQESEYRAISQWSGMIPNWESGGRGW